MRQKLVHQNVFNYLVKVVDQEFFPKRKRKIRNEDIVFQALRILKYGTSWRDTGSDGRYSWQTAHRRFSELAKNNKFQKSWTSVIRRYVERENRGRSKQFQNLYIDTTFIKNIGGHDCLGRNPTDRGRKATKLSVICDENRVIIGCHASPCSSDVKLVDDTLDSIPFDLHRLRRNRRSRIRQTYLIADKAYSSYALSDRMETRNIRLIVSKKKNSKRFVNKFSSTASARKKLAKRCTVEHCFGSMKRFKRIARREDRLCQSYMTFFHLGLLIRTIENFPYVIF